MKFRIIRDYDEYQPQVLVEIDGDDPYWTNIGYSTYEFIESAEEVCHRYKRMMEDPIVREFQL